MALYNTALKVRLGGASATFLRSQKALILKSICIAAPRTGNTLLLGSSPKNDVLPLKITGLHW